MQKKNRNNDILCGDESSWRVDHLHVAISIKAKQDPEDKPWETTDIVHQHCSNDEENEGDNRACAEKVPMKFSSWVSQKKIPPTLTSLTILIGQNEHWINQIPTSFASFGKLRANEVFWFSQIFSRFLMTTGNLPVQEFKTSSDVWSIGYSKPEKRGCSPFLRSSAVLCVLFFLDCFLHSHQQTQFLRAILRCTVSGFFFFEDI